MSYRKFISVGVALAGTLLFMALAVRNVEWTQLGSILATLRWPWLPVIVFMIAVVDIGLRALRWRILLSRAQERASLSEFFRLSAIGLAANNILFARLGELLRAILAARRLGLPLATVLASVAVDRAMDVVALLTLFVLAAGYLPSFVAAPIRGGGIALLAALAAALLFLVLAQPAFEPGGWVERRLRRWPWLREVAMQLALGASVLRRPRALIPVLVLSLGLWSVDAAVFWLGAYALGFQSHIDYPRAILVLSWAGAGSLLPAAPGAIGAF